MHNIENNCDNNRDYQECHNNGNYGLLIVVVLYILLAIIFSYYTNYQY